MLLKYQTQRLRVVEVSSESLNDDLSYLTAKAIELLTPHVVEDLPSYFQDVNTLSDAQLWIEKMLDDGLLLVVHHSDTNLICGFLFVHVEQDNEAYIGYLLGESYWGQGLATELLTGFIDLCIKSQVWRKLIGGVAISNKASIHLLSKLGFIQQPEINNSVVFFEFNVPHISLS